MAERQIEWTAREAFAAAYCWAEFSAPQDRAYTPETYWKAVTERTRNECRKVAGDRLLLAVARGQAVPVLPPASLREGDLAALKHELGMKADYRVRQILFSVLTVFKRPATQPHSDPEREQRPDDEFFKRTGRP